jgi:glycogen synthase
VPGEWPEQDRVGTLKRDALYFGLAVERMLAEAGSSNQFVWGADWETVPALVRARPRHLIALTLHNTFDECFEDQAAGFPAEYGALLARRAGTAQTKTALEVALELADVVTTVNRGFAAGMRSEPLQRAIMLNHLPWQLIDRVVGINNAAFSPLSADLSALHNQLEQDLAAGSAALFDLKAEARARLVKERGIDAGSRVMMVAMGRRSAQKQHDVVVEAVRQLLKDDPEFPLFVVFATTPEDGGEPRLKQMRALEREFPANAACFDGRIDFFHDLMTGADYNCMPSLYEPHGGAYEGTVVPIARAVDGLAEQICPLDPAPAAAAIAARWHPKGAAPTGFLFREESQAAPPVGELGELLSLSPSPRNGVFHAMTAGLKQVLKHAVAVRRQNPQTYARLVRAALERQQQSSWLINLGGMLALVEEARGRRRLLG